KQSYANKGGHWPFTKEHNDKGQIDPAKVMKALKAGGAKKISLVLELSFRERTPAELSMHQDLLESVQFWQSCV
ncbi:erythrose 4-phosphate dehydrogenase, partial [bacterium]|nr:erythrose 4-phosphate dehydrogenase [bacterium]